MDTQDALVEDVRAVMERIAAILPPGASGAPTEQQLRHFEYIATNLRRFGAARQDPVQSMLAHVGNFWSNAVLCALQVGPLRPSTLQKLFTMLSPQQPISRRMLTLNLRMLEEDGLIEREVHDLRNPHVEYRLTALGEDLTDILFSIIQWASVHCQQIRDARDHYEPPKAPALQRQRGWRS